jgi:biopolymer transport protein ExbD
MLQKVSSLFPNQAVIIRADEQTQHRYVVKVLDACASANIWNIAFATVQEEKGNK